MPAPPQINKTLLSSHLGQNYIRRPESKQQTGKIAKNNPVYVLLKPKSYNLKASIGST